MTTKTKAKSKTANRGLSFEKKVQEVCDNLRRQDKAMISKIPSDWRVIRGYKNGKSQIISAYTVEDSKFCDFVGITKEGTSIALEAKETKEKTSFPFKNISEFQIDFMDRWEEYKGKAYYIIHFAEYDKVYLVGGKLMKHTKETIGRKSIPYKWFEETEGVIELDGKKLNFIEYC